MGTAIISFNLFEIIADYNRQCEVISDIAVVDVMYAIGWAVFMWTIGCYVMAVKHNVIYLKRLW